MELKYACLDGFAVRLNDFEAWEFVSGEWQPLNSGEANHQATLIDVETLNRMFPGLPELPAAAFMTLRN
jgi:hypothetical protein